MTNTHVCRGEALLEVEFRSDGMLYWSEVNQNEFISNHCDFRDHLENVLCGILTLLLVFGFRSASSMLLILYLS
jgi:hypothetical protein